MITRTIYPYILKTIRNRLVTVITGAKQVGKSSFCKKSFRIIVNYKK